MASEEDQAGADQAASIADAFFAAAEGVDPKAITAAIIMVLVAEIGNLALHHRSRLLEAESAGSEDPAAEPAAPSRVH